MEATNSEAGCTVLRPLSYLCKKMAWHIFTETLWLCVRGFLWSKLFI